MGLRIGFISFRIAGTDGVSLETKKWAEIFERKGGECFYMAGELDTDPDRSFVVPEAHFSHPAIADITAEAFGRPVRPPELTGKIHHYRKRLKEALYRFVEEYRLDLIVPQNALAIPLNVPFGLALSEFIAETEFKTIGHHHDFFWERKRFLRNCVWDYLNMSYPPHLNSVQHVVINSSAANQLALRTGISSVLIPNVMDFDNPPGDIGEYNRDVRKDLGVADDELLILQPTRVVQRKGIEHAIELVARLKMKAVLVISHAAGDEGHEYQTRVREYADLLGIRALFVDDIIDDTRGTTADGRKIYSLQDVYPHADLVTYPSIFEGFGNAFLEAIYFHKPIMVNNYSIYSHDIRPKGFDVIEMDDFISTATVRETRELLENPKRVEEMVRKNYEIAARYFSYRVLAHKLAYVVTALFGENGDHGFTGR